MKLIAIATETFSPNRQSVGPIQKKKRNDIESRKPTYD